MTLSAEQSEYLRHAVLTYLAARFPLRFSAQAIATHLHNRQLVDFPVTDADVAASAELLCGVAPALVSREHDPLGSTIYYGATSDGVLAWERSHGGRS
jgi:hypothetical protein